MPFAWKPVPGQVALIELPQSGNQCLTGVVIGGEDGPVVIDLGASPRPPSPECEVIASFFAPDALYRMSGTVSPHEGQEAVVDLRVHDVERVQRRNAPRARISITAVMSDFDDPGSFASVVGETIDIGEGGCRMLTPKPFPSGSDPTVTLQLPTGEEIVALAAILQATGTTDGRYEYRLVFLELDEVDRLRLAELIAEPATA